MRRLALGLLLLATVHAGVRPALAYVHRPQVGTDNAGNWVALWTLSGNGNLLRVLAARSTDNGATWTTPTVVHETTADVEEEVEIAAEPGRPWIAAWSSSDSIGGTTGDDIEILYSRSLDGGSTWSAARPLNTNASSDSGDDSSVRLDSDGAGTLVAAWSSTDSLSGTTGTNADILVARSTDDGATWTTPAAIDPGSVADSRRDDGPQVATDGAGHWVVVWRSWDPVNGSDVLMVRSSDNGVSWSTPIQLTIEHSGSNTWGGFHPEIATDRAGNWIVAWITNHSLDGTTQTDMDLLFTRSTDNGATWSAPEYLNADGQTDSRSDTGEIALAATGASKLVAVWWTGSGWMMMRAISNDGGNTWSPPSPMDLPSGAGLRADGDGQGSVIVTWAGHSRTEIALTRSTTGGVFWSPASLLETLVPVCAEEPAEASECFAAPTTKLEIFAATGGRPTSLSWQWSRGADVTNESLGTPPLETDYTLCIYDTASSVATLTAALPIGHADAWEWGPVREGRPMRFEYKSDIGSAGGVTKLQLKSGSSGRTKVKLVADGDNLDAPIPMSESYFMQSPAVVVQLRNSVHECWTSSFTPADTAKNTTMIFKAQTH